MSDRDRSGLLVHICCAPCAEYPLKVLAEEPFDLHGFYYNPNIHPAEEWRRRMEGVRFLTGIRGIPCMYDDTILQEEWETEGSSGTGRMCARCYGMRMEKAAETARSLGIPAFTTTLLVSPYQRHDLLREQAERAAERAGVRFLYRDFRPGYRAGQEMARQDGIYRQKYCGCIDSLNESSFRERILREHQALRDRQV
ncbi:MAG: epoxyqueuosine reductase QueH [Clostridia bacterium]|nr:epoxyqueuosine reductase QueH [Clostridia bacterium]